PAMPGALSDAEIAVEFLSRGDGGLRRQVDVVLVVVAVKRLGVRGGLGHDFLVSFLGRPPPAPWPGSDARHALIVPRVSGSQPGTSRPSLSSVTASGAGNGVSVSL